MKGEIKSSHCQVCRKECKPRRCTRCQNAFYCSIDCQKQDWKAGHRQSCSIADPFQGPSQETAQRALQELFQISQSLSTTEAKEQFDRASDEVKSQQQEFQSIDENGKGPIHQESNLPNNTGKGQASHSLSANQANEQSDRASAEAKSQQKEVRSRGESINEPIDEESNLPVDAGKEVEGHHSTDSSPAQKKDSPRRATFDNFSIVVEEMKHVCQFQVTLRCKRNDDLDLQSLVLSKSKVNYSTSRIEVQTPDRLITLFAGQLPRVLRLEECQMRVEDDTTLQLRLPFCEDICARELGRGHPLTQLETINSVQCRYCEEHLLPSKPILRTCELPAGYWDEIADYLICYSGQPIVDFCTVSASADPSVAFQDSNVLCINQNDLGSTASIMAVTGYGEVDEEEETKQDQKSIDGIKDAAATIRGDRSWRDLTAGATVCCSRCSAPIGFAALESPETFRLLKHCLSVPDPSAGTPPKRLSSCASFLAREMVRYAESKAIFTFVVTLDAPTVAFASTVYTKCILLRLVSWDTNMAVSFDQGSEQLDFRRFAKLVFQETYDKQASMGMTEGEDGRWIWGGVDLCCPPPSGNEANSESPVQGAAVATAAATAAAAAVTATYSNETRIKTSTVRMKLHPEEYQEVLASLRSGTSLFSKAIAEATILVKLGTSPSSSDDNDLGLTAIPLDC